MQRISFCQFLLALHSLGYSGKDLDHLTSLLRAARSLQSKKSEGGQTDMEWHTES